MVLFHNMRQQSVLLSAETETGETRQPKLAVARISERMVLCQATWVSHTNDDLEAKLAFFHRSVAPDTTAAS